MGSRLQWAVASSSESLVEKEIAKSIRPRMVKESEQDAPLDLI